MERNVGKNNVQLLRSLLQKQYEAEITKLRDNFTYNFTKDKPYFELVLRVDERDFLFKVMEAENALLRGEVDTLKGKLKKYEPKVMCSNTLTAAKGITSETIHDFDDAVVAHQIRDSVDCDYPGPHHRLVICCVPPQIAGEWVPCHITAYVGPYYALANGKVGKNK